MEGSRQRGGFARLRRVYPGVAVLTLNTLLLLVLLNLLLYAGFAASDAWRRHASVRDWVSRYTQKLKSTHQELSEDDLRQLMRETLGVSYAFEPFTQFRDSPRRGRFVNVDEHGFRHSTGQGPWPPSPDSFNVFFFGGSTTFGWALPDDATIPSRFQQLLPRVGGRRLAVYNFARMAYFSTQERILYEQLLLAGHRPDAVVFVDGLNDLHWREGKPLYTSRFAETLEGRRSWFPELPMIRLARTLRDRLPFPPPAAASDHDSGGRPEDFQAALSRYLGNKQLIESASAGSSVVPLFVWQPVPSYKHRERGYRFRGSPPWRLWKLDLYAPVYAEVEERSRAGSLGRGFVWCGGVQESLDESLYLDLVHYNPRLSELVAECIARQVRERNLLPL